MQVKKYLKDSLKRSATVTAPRLSDGQSETKGQPPGLYIPARKKGAAPPRFNRGIPYHPFPSVNLKYGCGGPPKYNLASRIAGSAI